MDFLVKHTASISFTDRKVRFHDGNISSFVMSQSRNRLLNSIRKQNTVLHKEIIRLGDVVQLPAHSAKKIRVETTLFPKVTMVQCTPEGNSCGNAARKLTLLPGIYMSDGNSTEVLMVNLGPSVVALRKDEILGFAQYASVALIPLESNSNAGLKTENKVTPKTMQSVIEKVNIIIGDLSPQDQGKFRPLLGKYAGLLTNNGLKCVKNVQYSIQTQVGTKPNRYALYQAGLEARREIEKQVNHLIEGRLVQRSQSP